MAEKTYKLNEVIKIVYQAPNKETGLVGVVAEIILPDDEKDSNFPDMILTEVGHKGVYKGTFTPDAQGEWTVICHKSDDDGQVMKRYSVGAHNVHSVGDKIDTVDGKVDAVDTKVDAVDAQLDIVEGKIDDIVTDVGSLDTPPMIS